ncbi:peptidoglycan editing factor PgeF [Pelotomaculum terephthalicicum JT]|uniref:peptidoglycan editing factor PgeF n=1 Tax=Pelotomaculum terephthalicicum TaxID=206393 RepID=UPI0009C7DAF0|nr:peptidoglycan editing factor PgeF [Pelotomaculum terephthalicicum]MCG9968057.1 peptidoglycan editing factor PgeF [Pelotomaculum terephthalicicum JT]OPY63984.1 MAG: Laccase domain protein [Pelotomaculum sp. PtaU1.Bin065]
MRGFVTEVKNHLQFYQIPMFEATGQVKHGFTTRGGGESRGPYSSLNTAFHVGDAVENVRANRALACRALGINPDDIVAGRQVHGDNVEVVVLSDKGRGARVFEDALPDVDALVTAVPGVPLSSYYADCVPIFLLDPVQGVVALAHAGWKGTVAKIGLKTVQKMVKVCGTNPADCLAGVGPSIGPCCYEVNGQVIGLFKKSFSNWAELVESIHPGKWRLNLWKANYHTLLEAGLPESSIAMAGVCTSCRNDQFFSYRAAGGITGRMASFIMLK